MKDKGHNRAQCSQLLRYKVAQEFDEFQGRSCNVMSCHVMSCQYNECVRTTFLSVETGTTQLFNFTLFMCYCGGDKGEQRMAENSSVSAIIPRFTAGATLDAMGASTPNHSRQSLCTSIENMSITARLDRPAARLHLLVNGQTL